MSVAIVLCRGKIECLFVTRNEAELYRAAQADRSKYQVEEWAVSRFEQGTVRPA